MKRRAGDVKDHRTRRIDSMQMDDDDDDYCCCPSSSSALSLPTSSAASWSTTSESEYSTVSETSEYSTTNSESSSSDPTRNNSSLFDDTAVYSMIAQHYFTSSAPAFAAELRTLLPHRTGSSVRLAALTRLTCLLPRRLRRPLWSCVVTPHARIEASARRHLAASLSLNDFQMLGRRISPRAVKEWDLEKPVRGVWDVYQAYYGVLCRLARGEYEESRRGWEGMVRDVRVLLQIIYTVACVGGGGGGGAEEGGQCGAMVGLGGRRGVGRQAVEIVA